MASCPATLLLLLSPPHTHTRPMYMSPTTPHLCQHTQGILDPTLELSKLDKKCGEVSGRLQQLRKKMSLPGYADKTPQNVQDDDADRLARAEAELSAAQQHMEEMKKMIEEQPQQQQQ